MRKTEYGVAMAELAEVPRGMLISNRWIKDHHDGASSPSAEPMSLESGVRTPADSKASQHVVYFRHEACVLTELFPSRT